jgi:predicted MFS family arabinose efflux permease
MATCPKCGGYLGDDHRCSGAWRHAARTMGVALGGAAFGVVAVRMVAEHPSMPLLAATALLAAVLVTAVWGARSRTTPFRESERLRLSVSVAKR